MNTVLELIGNRFSLEIDNEDFPNPVWVITVFDKFENYEQIKISKLEMEISNFDLLLNVVEKCITRLKAKERKLNQHG